MPTLPIRPKKLPSVCSTFTNGSPPASLLRDPGDGLGDMLTIPSYGMQALHLHARQRGIVLETTGRGRSYTGQVNLFLARMTPTFDATVNTQDDSRVVAITDTVRHPDLVQGRRWYKRKGVAACASPGTSNHGWYSADDLSEERDADPQTDSLSAATLEYLIEWAPRFGWTWELQSEPWHVTWANGDLLPPLAVEVLTAAGVPIVGQPPPQEAPPMATLPENKQIRLLDTRKKGGRLADGDTRTLMVPGDRPSWAQAAIVNIVAVETGGPGYLTAWNGVGDPPAEKSSVNFDAAGRIVSNVCHVPLDGHTFKIFARTGTHLVVDLQGYDSVLI